MNRIIPPSFRSQKFLVFVFCFLHLSLSLWLAVFVCCWPLPLLLLVVFRCFCSFLSLPFIFSSFCRLCLSLFFVFSFSSPFIVFVFRCHRFLFFSVMMMVITDYDDNGVSWLGKYRPGDSADMPTASQEPHFHPFWAVLLMILFIFGNWHEIQSWRHCSDQWCTLGLTRPTLRHQTWIRHACNTSKNHGFLSKSGPGSISFQNWIRTCSQI